MTDWDDEPTRPGLNVPSSLLIEYDRERADLALTGRTTREIPAVAMEWLAAGELFGAS